MSVTKYLDIYLNDHLAGATAGIELAKRCAGSNRENELGVWLETFIDEIQDDRRTLEEIMDSLEIERSKVKPAAGWLAEKFGRLKFNGQVRGYSPLSRVIELEGLIIGVRARLALWETLRSVAKRDGRVVVDLQRLIERAQSQIDRLDEHRTKAVELSFENP